MDGRKRSIRRLYEAVFLLQTQGFFPNLKKHELTSRKDDPGCQLQAHSLGQFKQPLVWVSIDFLERPVMHTTHQME
ncbi:hypothetical protein QQP08_011009 [Theobroma cacao]|nr:hypothetical protein QQP08_011009 [Theobroma cacao]